MHCKKSVLVSSIFLCATSAYGAQYNCTVKSKFDTEHHYTKEQISKSKFSVQVKENPNIIVVSRCSFSPIVGKIICDDYEVDKVIYDEYVKIKKYYVFRGQFDMQIFSNMSFVENNGRGGIAFGDCEITSP
jgi:hypothetical protein